MGCGGRCCIIGTAPWINFAWHFTFICSCARFFFFFFLGGGGGGHLMIPPHSKNVARSEAGGVGKDVRYNVFLAGGGEE